MVAPAPLPPSNGPGAPLPPAARWSLAIVVLPLALALLYVPITHRNVVDWKEEQRLAKAWEFVPTPSSTCARPTVHRLVVTASLPQGVQQLLLGRLQRTVDEC